MEEFKEELEEGKDAANAGIFVTVPFVNAPSLASLMRRDHDEIWRPLPKLI